MNPSDPARLADLERRLSRLEDIEALAPYRYHELSNSNAWDPVAR